MRVNVYVEGNGRQWAVSALSGSKSVGRGNGRQWKVMGGNGRQWRVQIHRVQIHRVQIHRAQINDLQIVFRVSLPSGCNFILKWTLL